MHLSMEMNLSGLIRDTQSAEPTHVLSGHPLPGAPCSIWDAFPLVLLDVVCCFTPQMWTVGWLQLNTRGVYLLKGSYMWFKAGILSALGATYLRNRSPVILANEREDAIHYPISAQQLTVNHPALMIP